MSSYNPTQISQFDLTALCKIANDTSTTRDSRLFDPPGTLLTYDGCRQLVAEGNNWKPFALADVRYRFQLWKTPLILLIAHMHLPPLGWRASIFVILHLIGDPLDTIWSLSHKISLCHSRAEKWSGNKDWKAMATVVISYEEWGKGDKVEAALLQAFRAGNPWVEDVANRPLADDQQERLRDACRNAAQSLSADRSTSSVPVAVSIAIFFGAIWIAFDKHSPSSSNDSSCQLFSDNEGITPYYIAHTALYISVLPAVLLSAVIGVSQDRDSIPHILNQLQKDTEDTEDHMQPTGCFEHWKRITSGGIYSWQPGKWQSLRSGDGDGCWRSRLLALLSFTSIVSGCLIAIYMAYTALPRGFGCREIAIISTFVLWILSAAFDFYAENFYKPHIRYARVFLKDLLCSTAIVVYNVFVYLGIYNRCSCWTKFGRGPLICGQRPEVKRELAIRMKNEWPRAIASLVALQILLVLVTCAVSYKGVILLLSKVRNNATHTNHDSDIGWQHIFFTLRRVRQWWRETVARRRHVHARRDSKGDRVELVSDQER
jgi:hypothetical protein